MQTDSDRTWTKARRRGSPPKAAADIPHDVAGQTPADMAAWLGRRSRGLLLWCRRPVRRAGFAIVLGCALVSSGPLARSADAVTIGGPFTLKAPDGTTVTDRTYRGKWLLVYFGYTSCPDLCPTTLLDIAETLKELGSDAAEVQPLFITLDPERDTPDVMGAYVSSFDPRIVGLTGSSEDVDAVVRAYGAYVARHGAAATGRDDLLDHSNAVYLMNPAGVFVRAFDSDWSGAAIASALRPIMVRSRNTTAEDGNAASR